MQCTSRKLIIESVILLTIAGILFYRNPFDRNDKNERANDTPPQSSELPKKDWHDYRAMYYDSRRIGAGEQGKGARLMDDVDQELANQLLMQYGFNALLSEAISVNRSVADVRHEGCLNKKYLVDLPSVSIVIPFHNEYFSVVVRSLHSIVNRTPPALLKEIIIVDDLSDDESLGKQLDEYVAKHFDKVEIVRLPERVGLICARLVGLRKATAEVLVILDAHIEVNYNWLPPLLEPIVLDKRTVMSPIVDRIFHSDFEYLHEDGGRGGFDWGFLYITLPHLPETLLDRSKPYETPVMIGGLLAISAEFFWELGGYDEGLDIWGGEQFELSFKIWMCGGRLLDAPCSRVGHLYRRPHSFMPNPRKTSFLYKNYKRVAEVWMDEYKYYLYKRSDVYATIDAGNLTAQKAIREKLQCKSFKWYMEEVAFDLLKMYPPVEPPDYANGSIQSVGSPNLCIDNMGNEPHSIVGLHPCAKNLTSPHNSQNFALTFRRDLRLRHPVVCLEIQKRNEDFTAWLWTCHGGGGNQFWYYDRKNKWLVYERNGTLCLEASPSDGQLVAQKCQDDNLNMQWNFGVVNDTALDSFFENING